MTEFTSEFITHARQQMKNFENISLNNKASIEALDHIERQQQRIAELEEQVSKNAVFYKMDYDRLTQHIAELEQEQRWIPDKDIIYVAIKDDEGNTIHIYPTSKDG